MRDSWLRPTLFLMPGLWLSAWIASDEIPEGETKAVFLTLAFLIGSVPFFARRGGSFGTKAVAAICFTGVGISLLGKLVGFPAEVPLVFGYALAMSLTFEKNASGEETERKIEEERSSPNASRFLATKTEQEQNVQWLIDFLFALMGVGIMGFAYHLVEKLLASLLG